MKNIFIKRISSKNCIFLILILPLLMVLGIEMMQRGSFSYLFEWIYTYKVEFVINYLLALSLYILLFSIFNSLRLGTVIYTSVLTLFSIINLYKTYLLGEPFYPWDIFLYKYVLNLLEELLKEIGYKYIIIVAVVPFVIYYITKGICFELRLKLKKRLLACLFSFCFVAIFSVLGWTPLEEILLKAAKIERISWEQNLNYEQNGTLLGFVMNTEFAFVKAPKGYSKEMVIEAVEKIKNFVPLYDEGMEEEDIKPDIVVIMNEALWDPLNIKSADFSKDPLHLIRKLQSGTLISPEFGGGTANVEFEFLTGFSNVFLPHGSIAYQQYIYQPIPSMAKRLKKYGYETIAIHPNYKWFYKRDEVYQNLGFDKFYGIESFDEEEKRGVYISDMAVSESIINKIENSSGSNFIFAITMQNHGPYDEYRYEDIADMENISIDSSLEPELLKTLEVFTLGVSDADQSVKKLIDYFENSSKPTIFAIFGDHLPFLGTDYGVYQSSGFIEKANISHWSLEDYINMRSTPLVVWTNYMDEKHEVGNISPAYLGQEILKISGLKMSLFDMFLQKLHQELPVYLYNVKQDSQGKLMKGVPSHMNELLECYWVVQYDQMLGKQYSKELFE